MAKPHTTTPAPVPASRLDRSSFVPLYFQLAEILKERIEGGRWKPGDRFPSEGQLGAEFGVSRTVIRPALALLESDGQLVRIKGRGTFVAQPKRGVRIAGLVRILSHPLPDDLSLHVVGARLQDPEPIVADVLSTGHEQVTHITAVGSMGGQPLFICDSFSLPADVPWLRAALSRHLIVPPGSDAFGEAQLTRGTVQIDIAYVSHWEAAQLGLAAGQTCYLLRTVEWGIPAGERETRALEFARLVYPVDTVQFIVELGGGQPTDNGMRQPPPEALGPSV